MVKFDPFIFAALCLLQSLGIDSFNIDVGKAVVFDAPAKSEYFGYSVALHSYRNSKWAIVGAPLSNVTSRFSSETFPRYGAAYRCEYTGSQQCSIIDIDDAPADIDPSSQVEIEEKSGQWLGGVVYSTGTNGKALACAPRYIYRGAPIKNVNAPGGEDHYRWVLGKCFLLNPTLSEVERKDGVLEPCKGETYGNNAYGYCEAGISAQFSADGYDVIMGIVGAIRLKGGIIIQSGSTEIKSPKDQLKDDDYMGYAVSSGAFSDRIRPEVVGGAPRADGVKGKALIYSYNTVDGTMFVKSPLPQPKNLPTGTYFGSVICVVDLDNNNFPDILIGAPYFTHVKDEGRVYIYLNNGQGALNLQDDVLEGDKIVNAHFGQAIAAVGDLNADGFQDVAIGAPMEGKDGSGAVYIYHGSSKGIETQYRQKIVGSKVKSGIKMFGISVAGGVDVDDNKYPDIAVGAYESGNAVIMRSQSIVKVQGSIKLSKQQITLEGNDSMCELEGLKRKCLNITVALSYEDMKAATASKDLNIKYSVELDKDKDRGLRRMFFWDDVNKQRVFTLEKNFTLSSPKTNYEMEPRTVYLMDKDEIGDVSSLLTFDLNLLQPQPPCPDLCPVLDDYMANKYRAEAAFRKKCKNQIACFPDLAVSGEVVYNPRDAEELRLGVVKDFVVQLKVNNKAEDSAYTTKIKLKHPDTLDYIGPDQGVECTKGPSDNGTITLTCDVANPLFSKTEKTFGIKFSPGAVRENFVIEVEASSQDKDTEDKDNKAKLSVTVKFEADVEIKGSSKQDRVVYQGPERTEEEIKKSVDSIGPEVIQTLSVRNKGPSEVDGAVVTVNFPNLYSSSNPKSYLLYLLLVETDGASVSCDAKVNPEGIKASNDTSPDEKKSRKRRDTEENMLLDCRQASCKSFKCSLGLLKKDDKVEIKMTFRLWENTLLKELETPKAVDLETSARVKVPDKITQPDENNDKTTIITTASPAQTEAQEKKTPWWVIFLSVLGGVLLLAGAIAVLYKLGFFKRKRLKDISGPMEEDVPMTT